MLLRHVYLYLATDEFPQGMGSEFLFRCCYLNNYLTSRMRELRLVREYRGIFFQGSGVVGVPRIGFERGLLVPVAFSPTRYAALHPGEEHEFFIAMITEGMERCAPEHSIPIDAMQAALEDFRRGGYRNEWTHQRKLLRPVSTRRCFAHSIRSASGWSSNWAHTEARSPSYRSRSACDAG